LLVNNLQSNTTRSKNIEFTKEEEKITHLQKELLFGKFGFLKNSLCIQNLLFDLSISLKHIIWPISSQFARIYFLGKSCLMKHLWYHGGQKKLTWGILENEMLISVGILSSEMAHGFLHLVSDPPNTLQIFVRYQPLV
jgi:hypothetical protein